MNSVIPSFLKRGDYVGVWAPARFVTPSLIAKGLEMFESFGFVPIISDLLYNIHFQFAGKEEDRLDVFNNYLKNEEVKAVVCAKGGYGSMRLLQNLDGESLLRHPRWVTGFSDVTAVHAWLNHSIHIPSIHGIMLSGMDDQGDRLHSSLTLLYALSGQLKSYEISAEGNVCIGLRDHVYAQEIKIPKPFSYRSGQAKAKLVGGNLSLIYALASTPYDLSSTERFILFFEDLDEYLYHIDRMMQQLKLSGKLDQLDGLIVGAMTEMHDNTVRFGKSAYEIVNEYMDSRSIPYYIGFPAGHQDLNLALYLGMEVSLEVGEDGSFKLEY